MTPFAITAPGRILFGRGEAAKAPGLIRTFGQRVLIVHGAAGRHLSWLSGQITASGGAVQGLPCRGEPTLAMLEDALLPARDFAPQVVVAIGGGAVLDLGKALAALIPAPDGAMAHLEVVGKGLPLVADPLPFVALPTTAGTGAEVTRNAVIGLPDLGRKVSLRDDRMVARLAIVDPALTDHCPAGVTLASGLDALVQVIEPFVCNRANAFTDALAWPAIGLGLAALRQLMAGENAEARDHLAWASLCGGIALSNAGLGAVHGLAGVLGGMTPAPHGLICGRLIGPVLRANRDHAGGEVAARLDRVCGEIAGQLGGTADRAPETLMAWVSAQGLAPLRSFGLARESWEDVAVAALASSSMKANPVPLGVPDLRAILDMEDQPADQPQG